MTDKFLKLNKDLYKLKLDTDQQYILAYVMEFDRNKQQCYMSDESFAMCLNTSTKTVSRKIKILTDKGYITKETTNTQNGKLRYLKPVLNKIENDIKDYESSQGTKCPLEINEEIRKGQNVCCGKDNLSIRKGQNDLIKDNLKDNRKDNISEPFGKPNDSQGCLTNGSNENTPKNGGVLEEPEVERDGSKEDKAIIINREKLCILVDNQNYKQLGNNLYKIANKYYTVVD